MKYSKHNAYFNTNNREVPSVTTILSLLNKPVIAQWANYLGFKRIKMDDVLKQTSTIGTYVHNFINGYLRHNDLLWCGSKSEGSIVFAHLESFKEWAIKNKIEPILLEESMASSTFGGTVDFYGKLNDKFTIIDFKTSKKAYSSMFLQLAAYCYMLEERGHEVEQVGILIVNTDNSYFKFMSREQLEPYMKTFMQLVKFFHMWYFLNIRDKWGDILAHKS